VTVADAEAIGGFEWERARARWIQAYRSSLTKSDVRIAGAVERCVANVAAYGAKKGSVGNSRFDQAERFVSQLDSELRRWQGSPFKDDKALWRHIDFRDFLKKTSVGQREQFFELDESVDEYISNPALQDDYFDWVLLDVIVAQKLAILFDGFMRQKHGGLYSVVGAVRWKLLLGKFITVPLSIAFGWVLPAVGFYFIAKWNLWVGVALAAVYYGFSALLLLRWLWLRGIAILTGVPSPTRRLLAQMEEVEQTYQLLAGQLLHVGRLQKAIDRTIDKGVMWNPAVFYILDAVSARNPQPWRKSLSIDLELREQLEKVGAAESDS
jgi:hypothetical protein